MKEIRRQQLINQRYSPQNQNAALKETVFTLFPSIKEDSSLRIYKETQNSVPSIHVRINPLYERQIFTMYSGIKKAFNFYQRFNQNDFWENVVCAADELKGDRVNSGQQIGFSSKDELRDTKNLLRDLKIQIAFKHSILQAILTEQLSMRQQHHDLTYSYADKSSVKPKNHIKLYIEQEIKEIKRLLNKENHQQTEQQEKASICSPFKNGGVGLVKCKRLQRLYWERSNVYGEQVFKKQQENEQINTIHRHQLLETLFGGNLLNYWYGFQVSSLYEIVDIADADLFRPCSFIGHGIEPSQLPESDTSFFLSRQINAFTTQLIQSFLGKTNTSHEEKIDYFGSTTTQEALQYYSQLMLSDENKQLFDIHHQSSSEEEKIIFVDVEGIDRVFKRNSVEQVKEQKPTPQIIQQNSINNLPVQPIKPLGLGPSLGIKPGLGLGLGARGPLNIAKPAVSVAPSEQPTTHMQVPSLQNIVLNLEHRQKANSGLSDVSAVTMQSLGHKVIQASTTSAMPVSVLPSMGIGIPKARPGIQLPSMGMSVQMIGQGIPRDPLNSLGLGQKPVIPNPAEQTAADDNTSIQSHSTIRTTVGASYIGNRKDFSQLLAKPTDLINKHLTKQQLTEFLPLFQMFYMLQRQFLMVLYRVQQLNNTTLEGANMIYKGLDDILQAFSGNQGNALKAIFECDMIKKQIQDRFSSLKAAVV